MKIIKKTTIKILAITLTVLFIAFSATALCDITSGTTITESAKKAGATLVYGAINHLIIL